MYVVTAEPPNHIFTALLHYKRGLFRITGNPSFIALPPVIITGISGNRPDEPAPQGGRISLPEALVIGCEPYCIHRPDTPPLPYTGTDTAAGAFADAGAVYDNWFLPLCPKGAVEALWVDQKASPAAAVPGPAEGSAPEHVNRDRGFTGPAAAVPGPAAGFPGPAAGIFLGTSLHIDRIQPAAWQPGNESCLIWRKGRLYCREIIFRGEHWWKDLEWEEIWTLGIRTV